MAGKKLSLRLTPHQERVLEAMRRHALPDGASPRARAAVLVVALLEQAQRIGVRVARDIADDLRRGADPSTGIVDTLTDRLVELGRLAEQVGRDVKK